MVRYCSAFLPGRVLATLFGHAILLVIVACGAGSTAVPKSQGLVIEGYVVDGPIVNATLRIFNFSQGVKGALLGSAQTDRNGHYKAELRRGVNGPILMEATSGTYQDDISPERTTIPLSNSGSWEQRLNAVANLTQGEVKSLNLTPYTTLATGLAEYAILQGQTVATAINQANQTFSALLGHDIDILNTRPNLLTEVLGGDRNLSKEYVYGLYSGAFSAYAKRISELTNSVPYTSYTAIGLLQKMYLDIRGDGLLDGIVVYMNDAVGASDYGIPLDSVNYRHELGIGLLHVGQIRQSKSDIAYRELVSIARALGESTDPVFGGNSPALFDEEPPLIANDTLEMINYNRSLKYAEYRVDVRDDVGLQRVSVWREVANDNAKSAYIQDILPRDSFKLNIADFGPGAHALRIEAIDLVGNRASKTFEVTLPDGKPIVQFTSQLITNGVNYRAGGTFFDDGDAGIRSISVAQGQKISTATIEARTNTWWVDLELAPGDNSLLVRITDNLGQYKEITRNVTLDTSEPGLTVSYGAAELYKNNRVVPGNLSTATATGDLLYIPKNRIGYANTAVDPSTLTTAKIPFYTFRVQDDHSPPSAITLRIQYRINDVIKYPFRIIAPVSQEGGLYHFPLIKETLSEDWYQSNPEDIHNLEIEIIDEAGNINQKTSLSFRAFFDVPVIRVASPTAQSNVTIYTFSEGARGGMLGSCKTNEQGTCAIRTLVDSQLLYAELNGGYYKESSNDTTMAIPSTELVSSILDFKGADTRVVLTPFTHLGVGLVKYAIAQGVTATTAYTQTVTDLTAIYGFDVFSTVPDNLSTINTNAPPLTSEKRYALLLAGISEWAVSASPASGTMSAAQLFFKDANSDGLLDGFALDAQGNRIVLALSDKPLDANTYRYQLANSALTLVSQKFTWSAPVMEAIIQIAESWAGSAHPRFNGVAPVAVVVLQPNMAVVSPILTTSANYPMRVRVTPGTIAVGAVRVGSAAATPVSGTREWTATARLTVQGGNTVIVRVFDTANNELFAQNYTISLDSVGPTLVIEQPVDNGNIVVNSASLTISGTVADDNGVESLTISLGTQTNRFTRSPWAAQLQLSPGSNTIVLEARDTLGNVYSRNLGVTYSVPGPLVIINRAPAVRTSDTKPVFGGSVDPQGVSYTLNATLYLDSNGSWTQKMTQAVKADINNAWALDFFSVSNTSLASGRYRLRMVAQNSQKNSTTTDYQFAVDTLGPNLRLISPAATRENPYTLVIEALDAGGGVVSGVTVGGGSATALANNQWSYTPARAATDGERRFSVSALDDLGNVSTQLFTVILDTVVPLIAITEPVLPALASQKIWRNSTNMQLGYNVSDASSPVFSSVQANGNVVLAEGPHALTVNVQVPLDLEGANRLHVGATDGVGNQAAKDFTVYRDTIAPQLTGVNAPPAVVAAAKADFTIAVNEPNLKSLVASVTSSGNTPISGEIVLDVTTQSSVTTSVGSLNYAATSGQLSGTIGLGSGTNTIIVKAFDMADNMSNTMTFSTRLDTAAPLVAVDNLNVVTNTVSLVNANFSGTASDDSYPVTLNARYRTLNNRCQLGTQTNLALGSVNSNRQPWAAVLPAEGAYQLTVTATDSVNNLSSASMDVIYDATAPTVALGAANTALKTTSFTFNVSEPNLASIRLEKSVGGVSESVTANLTCNGSAIGAINASNATGSITFDLANNTGTATVALSAGDNAIRLVVTDKSGKSTNSNTLIAAIETLPPTASIGNTGTIVGNTVVTTQSSLSIVASDASTGGSGIASVSFSGGGSGATRVVTNPVSGVYTDTFKQTADGSYDYSVQIVDGVGNLTVLTPTLIRDTSAPTLKISAPADESSTQSAVVAFTISISDGNPLPNPVVVTVKVGSKIVTTHDVVYSGTVYSLNNYSFDVALLSGSNRYDLTIVDAYNKVSPVASVNVTRNRDSTSPSVSITSRPATPTNIRTHIITGTASDANPGTVVLVNKDINGATVSASAAVSFAEFLSPGISVDLVEGENNLTAIASDTQGNVRNSSTLKLILDTVAPVISIPATTASGATSVTGTVTDANLPSAILVNNLSYSVNSTTGRFTVTGLVGGALNTLTVSATDRAGNVTGPTQFTVNALP